MTDADFQDSMSREDPWMTCMRRGEFARALEISDGVFVARVARELEARMTEAHLRG
jgi:hypothetical protein